VDNITGSLTWVEDRAFPDQSGQAAHTAGDVASQRLDSDGYEGQSNTPIELVDKNRSEGLLPVFRTGRLDLYASEANRRAVSASQSCVLMKHAHLRLGSRDEFCQTLLERRLLWCS